MKVPAALSLALAVLMLSAPVLARETPPVQAAEATAPVADEAALLAANAAYDAALLARDRAAIEALFAPDYSFIGDEAEQRGRDEQIARQTEGDVQILEARSDQIVVTPLGPTAALLTGRFTGRVRMDEREIAFVERYTSVWVLSDGRWRLRHEHSSLEPDEAD